MLRNDGRYTIFKVQHWIKPGFMYKEGKWAESDLDQFLKGVNWWDDPVRRKELLEPYKSFSACGDCWQQTGEHGTYDSDTAVEMLKLLSKHNPDTKFRVIKVEIRQQTVGIFYYQPEEVKFNANI